MVNSVKKKIHYREALFLQPGRRTLHDVISGIFETLDIANSHPVELASGITLEGRFELRQDNYFLHIVTYTAREHAPTVRHRPDNFSEGSARPPQDSDYMDGSIWARFQDNHIVFMTHKAHESYLEKYILELLAQNNLGDDDDFFTVVKKVSQDTLGQLQSGVSEIDLNTTSSLATFEYAGQSTQNSFLRDVCRGLAALKEQDEPIAEIESTDMKVQVSLKVGKRGSELAQSEISSIAGSLVSQDADELEENAFIIRTNKGDIRPHELAISKVVRIRSVDKTLNKQDCFAELGAFYFELDESGMLDQ